MPLSSIQLGKDYDYLAPDGSEIRLLLDVNGGGLAHCILPQMKVSQAVKHKTVEEIWYILEGKGQMWRKNEIEEKLIDLLPNTTINIPVGTSFQFKNTGDRLLKILLFNMPPWPGPNEAIEVENYWKIN